MKNCIYFTYWPTYMRYYFPCGKFCRILNTGCLFLRKSIAVLEMKFQNQGAAFEIKQSEFNPELNPYLKSVHLYPQGTKLRIPSV